MRNFANQSASTVFQIQTLSFLIFLGSYQMKLDIKTIPGSTQNKLYDFLTFEFFTIYIDYIDIQLLIANVVFILFETLQGMRLHVICNHVAFLWMSWCDKPVLASNQYIAGLLCRTLLTPKMGIWPSDK